MLEFSDR